MKRIVVHINRLVLDGFDNKHAESIGAGMRGELVQLMRDSVTSARLASLGHVPSKHAGEVKVASDRDPHRLGVESARAIFKRISQ
jgi:hypothetical protein